jgi:hypothetical protein
MRQVTPANLIEADTINKEGRTTAVLSLSLGSPESCFHPLDEE